MLYCAHCLLVWYSFICLKTDPCILRLTLIMNVHLTQCIYHIVHYYFSGCRLSPCSRAISCTVAQISLVLFLWKAICTVKDTVETDFVIKLNLKYSVLSVRTAGFIKSCSISRFSLCRHPGSFVMHLLLIMCLCHIIRILSYMPVYFEKTYWGK